MKKNIKITNSIPKSNLYQLVLKGNNNQEIDTFRGKIFELPFEMTEKEMHIVLSYVLDCMNLLGDIDVCVFLKIDDYLEKIGFFSGESDQNEDINTIEIGLNYTKNNWYVKNSNVNQVKKIYDRIMYVFEEPQNFSNINKKTLKKRI